MLTPNATPTRFYLRLAIGATTIFFSLFSFAAIALGAWLAFVAVSDGVRPLRMLGASLFGLLAVVNAAALLRVITTAKGALNGHVPRSQFELEAAVLFLALSFGNFGLCGLAAFIASGLTVD